MEYKDRCEKLIPWRDEDVGSEAEKKSLSASTPSETESVDERGYELIPYKAASDE